MVTKLDAAALTVCRFCGGKHNSKECADKIKEGVMIPPKCWNCGQAHKAGSITSEVQAKMSEATRRFVAAEPPKSNA
ncbi:hypothetical protein E2C01_038248 [Portunus trituberculatus]|uniref:Uncharacterized protein n=1 Tax=Portunus trituberculatus TaxID=210409 RepID=A0A5B7FDN9_PORTR|nr:hypothetical protein [Portunus trituberculatus]